MKSLALLLVVVVFAQAKVIPDLADGSVFGFIKNSIALGEELRKAEEEYLNGNQRIIGGSSASLGQFPYQAGLLSDIIGLNGNGVCGGVLVSPSRVLTAAHCWFDGQNQGWRYTVVLGSTTIWNGGVRIQTSNVIMHNNWAPANARNDIAVIYLPSNIGFTNSIAPAQLPSGSELNENFAGATAVASGWGRTTDNGGVSPTLNFINLSVITNNVCIANFPAWATNNNICTSGAGGVGTCRGDSGGPLVINRGNRRVLVGITSFGAARCSAGRPAAFARITSFTSFINQHV